MGELSRQLPPPAHALLEAVAPEPMKKAQTGILATLATVKEYRSRATAVVRASQCLDDQVGIGLGLFIASLCSDKGRGAKAPALEEYS